MDREHTDDKQWVFYGDIFRYPRVPTGVAQLLRRVIDKMTHNGSISAQAPWMALELLAANYLAEGGEATLGRKVQALLDNTKPGEHRHFQVGNQVVSVLTPND